MDIAAARARPAERPPGIAGRFPGGQWRGGDEAVEGGSRPDNDGAPLVMAQALHDFFGE
ncbi:hypothetical protein AB0M44_30775 [Streptosporangium subroseum]|uniref:hypothetical protein n=1 Tax=Streptosporangium subroseum TaxID=106412 RepID=UPI0034345CD5